MKCTWCPDNLDIPINHNSEIKCPACKKIYHCKKGSIVTENKHDENNQQTMNTEKPTGSGMDKIIHGISVLLGYWVVLLLIASIFGLSAFVELKDDVDKPDTVDLENLEDDQDDSQGFGPKISWLLLWIHAPLIHVYCLSKILDGVKSLSK
jgi:hypothetical protein